MFAKRAKVDVVLPPSTLRSDSDVEATQMPTTKAELPTNTTSAPKGLSPWVSSPISAFIGSFAGLGGLFVIENYMRVVHLLPDPMLAVGSFAAVATLMYAAPAAPLGKPWNLFYGHFLAICTSILVYYAERYVGWHQDFSVALAPSLSIAVMVHQKVIHPPAAACSFIFASHLKAHAQPLGGVVFLLVPGLVGCAYMLAVQRSVHFVVDQLYDLYQSSARKDSEQPDAHTPVS